MAIRACAAGQKPFTSLLERVGRGLLPVSPARQGPWVLSSAACVRARTSKETFPWADGDKNIRVSENLHHINQESMMPPPMPWTPEPGFEGTVTWQALVLPYAPSGGYIPENVPIKLKLQQGVAGCMI